MHSQLMRRRREDGAVAIIVAISLTALLVGVAMVLDFGLVRVDRQVDKSAADAATLAGLHGLNGGTTNPHPFTGVCSAIRYLQKNDARFSSLSSTTGTWTDAAPTPNPKGDGCDSATGLPGVTCNAAGPGTVPTSWARFTWTGGGVTVTIQSGYVLSSTSGWSEDALPAAAADLGATNKHGCDQLAVIITQTRKPGLGSLATSSDLQTSIRSVGRIDEEPGGYAPAMLLLKQSDCNILTTGTSAGGSQVKILGAGSNHLAQPGSIHSDSDGSGCGSNQSIYTGASDNGIVAYAAPLLDPATGNPVSPLAADPSKPGQLTAYAATIAGFPVGKLRDSTEDVCGSTLTYNPASPATDACPGKDVAGLDRVYRQPVDGRYFSAIQGMSTAATTAFATASSIPKVLTGCTPAQSDVDALGLSSTSSVYVTCSANNGFRPGADISIPAGTVVFAGRVNPQAKLVLPNATHVYIAGNAQGGLSLGGSGAQFSMHTSGPGAVDNTSGGLCSNASTGAKNKAVLVINNNTIDESNGSSLQLCYTTVLMKGGQTDACLGTVNHTGPPIPGTACGGGAGTGQMKQTGGNVDWTAPNRYDVMLLADGTPDPTKKDEWTDADGPEDLAFWSESGANGSGTKFQMTGGGTVHLVGVLMTPNAEPFTLSGQFVQKLVNAQYVASSIDLSSNNTQITMSVDPNSAVTLPRLGVIGLVR